MRYFGFYKNNHDNTLGQKHKMFLFTYFQTILKY